MCGQRTLTTGLWRYHYPILQKCQNQESIKVRRKTPGTGCVILSKLLNLSVLGFPVCRMWITAASIWGHREDEMYQYVYRHTLSYCSLLSSTLLYCVFYESKVCGNPASSKSIGAIFPTALAHFVSLCHVLVMLAIFQTLSFSLYLLW